MLMFVVIVGMFVSVHGATFRESSDAATDPKKKGKCCCKAAWCGSRSSSHNLVRNRKSPKCCKWAEKCDWQLPIGHFGQKPYTPASDSQCVAAEAQDVERKKRAEERKKRAEEQKKLAEEQKKLAEERKLAVGPALGKRSGRNLRAVHTEPRCQTTAGKKMSVETCASTWGSGGKLNQDSWAQRCEESKCVFVVLDGHGEDSHDISEDASARFVSSLPRLKSVGSEHDIREYVNGVADAYRTDGRYYHQGCTVTGVLMDLDEGTIASFNAGDGHQVFFRSGDRDPSVVTTFHTAALESEQERIARAGGLIDINSFGDYFTCGGELRQYYCACWMPSRSFGDNCLKRKQDGEGDGSQIMSDDPDVIMQVEKKFPKPTTMLQFVIGSDGVFDTLPYSAEPFTGIGPTYSEYTEDPVQVNRALLRFIGEHSGEELGDVTAAVVAHGHESRANAPTYGAADDTAAVVGRVTYL